MNTYYEFTTLDEAVRYRRRMQTGGWIFAPESGESVWLFPWRMTPQEILRHPLTQGRSGRVVGCTSVEVRRHA